MSQTTHKTSRTYTVVESYPDGRNESRVYLGFNRNFSRPSLVDQVALVAVEDTILTFVLDPDYPPAKSELIRYLSEQDCYQNHTTILGIYNR